MGFGWVEILTFGNFLVLLSSHRRGGFLLCRPLNQIGGGFGLDHGPILVFKDFSGLLDGIRSGQFDLIDAKKERGAAPVMKRPPQAGYHSWRFGGISSFTMDIFEWFFNDKIAVGQCFAVQYTV